MNIYYYFIIHNSFGYILHRICTNIDIGVKYGCVYILSDWCPYRGTSHRTFAVFTSVVKYCSDLIPWQENKVGARFTKFRENGTRHARQFRFCGPWLRPGATGTAWRVDEFLYIAAANAERTFLTCAWKLREILITSDEAGCIPS